MVIFGYNGRDGVVTDTNGLIYIMKFESDELKYEIFAYEFVDSDSALEYYVNNTGQTSYKKKLPLNKDDENKLLSASKGKDILEV